MTEPLAALDAAGKAAVISYDVPEPTSYSGRNFIELPLPDDAFTTVVVTASHNNHRANSRDDPKVDKHIDRAAMADSGNMVASRAVLAPDSVILTSGPPEASPILYSEQPLSGRLAKLTISDVCHAAEAGKQIVMYPDISGQLNYRLLRVAKDHGGDGDGQSYYDPTVPRVSVFIGTPGNNAQLRGSASGLDCPVAGRWEEEDTSSLTLKLSLDDGTATDVHLESGGTWASSVRIDTAGTHTIRATLTGKGLDSKQHKTVTVNDSAVITVGVTLDAANPNPPPVLPSLTITSPADNTTLIAPSGTVTSQLKGKATWGTGATITSIRVTDDFDGKQTDAASVGGDWSNWSVELLLSGFGRHRLTVIAIDDQGSQSSPQTVNVSLSEQLPFRRLKNRLMLVETLNLSSFLGSFGAGRVIKTFSLLPGEKTTLSIKSWTKSADSRKSGASIVDSDATEAADSFEDQLSDEQTSRESQSETSNYKIGAKAGASWGWGSASINAEYSGTANSARDEAVKNVRAATRKHSMKASANRSVTVNTEYTATQEAGEEESTTREIANINVSRTLNFVFRQMNQEHITLIHLTNVRIAYYAEDLMLDDKGDPLYTTDPTGAKVLDIRPTYTEVALPQLNSLLESTITKDWRPKVVDAIMFALSGIPDYTDHLQQVFEWVTPIKNKVPVSGAEYMRFPRKLETEFVDPVGHQVFTVPGIVLAYDRIVMRTEGVMVDTVLGQGEALDTYSQGLQDIAVQERQVAVAERQAALDRLTSINELACEIARSGDKDRAEVFCMVFPPPQPATQVPSVNA